MASPGAGEKVSLGEISQVVAKEREGTESRKKLKTWGRTRIRSQKIVSAVSVSTARGNVPVPQLENQYSGARQ